jgi:hypothetical protein
MLSAPKAPSLSPGRARHGSNTKSGRLIVVRVIVLAVVIVGGVFWGIGKNKEAAGHAATRFAAALVENDPDAAPKSSPEYIKGMRAYFGAVTGARVIGTHNERADADTSTSRTYPVADLLLRSARGPAVIELAFDNGGIGSEKVTSIYELHPDDAPKLPAGKREQLALAFAQRGGIPADEETLKRGSAETRQPAAPTPADAQQAPAKATPRPTGAQPGLAKPTPELRKARKELRCVQRARGDVTKLMECAP